MNPNGKGWHYLATKNYLHSNLFFPGTICAGLTAKLPSIANISKMVRVNIVFTTTFLKKYLISLLMTCRLIDFSIRILQLLMFKVCGIIGISEIEILNFSSTERAKWNNVQTSHIFLLPKLPYLNHIEKYVKIKDLFNIIIPP